MKQYWQQLSARIEALSLRERLMVFGAAAAALVFLVFFTLLDPLSVKQKTLNGRIAEQRNLIAGIDAEMTQKMEAYAVDPDFANKVRLQNMLSDSAQMSATLRSMQKGLVAPEKMVPLLEQLLRGNSKLRLLSLKTLPTNGLRDGSFVDDAPLTAGATSVKEGAVPARDNVEGIRAGIDVLTPESRPEPKPEPKAAAGAPAKPAPLLYRHGVEIVLQGNYLDMLSYMEALEAMPTQLFWGRASLKGDDFPNASLTLTLYTLSLDQKWISL
ncbi:MAG TPA: hypothetical protein DCW29_24595 [Janthinobacterium sp.]|nr:hypothetical protein [Janthinobacterium sp.]